MPNKALFSLFNGFSMFCNILPSKLNESKNMANFQRWKNDHKKNNC